ncbi:MAG: tryptophan--tRNA ligase [bacterium]|nr:tryptophan--tRNA ligase [bacterium]
MQKTIFSGIQPSGNLHIGNYIGAIKQWVNRQNDGFNIFCIVDMHAITVPQDPKALHEKSLELAALYLAAGINPEKSLVFIQSHNSDHANLGWLLNCYTSMGQMNRMTQYKDKSEGKDFVSVGLFSYPTLMAADILLYNTTEVPVGEDQKQHVELTRDVAERFNNTYGETFILPEPKIPTHGGRIRSLLDPNKKMSKSDSNPNATVNLLDPEEVIRKKIKSATTDSGSDIKYDMENKPGVSNLLDLYSQTSSKSVEEIEKECVGKRYGEFKEIVAESVVNCLGQLQAKYYELRNSDKLEGILKQGAEKSYQLSHKKLEEVYRKVGFVTR